ncbi:uncharacterized protein Z520_04091 [Fonsecaea multimorphosa CBS 102226]|uniref:Zn(2)-C6 fungal-type domain-containing protein n=1 Tax=Fonsecaea multimorphosa CBS 102226 TaxID=1442371 RepID=A0A0D2HEX6_9EURO|nr:uncharacterized protein Z520_04091 [Fonsecaea multimorphosa CBS 102226]KIY00406.1 hypothetical protein Z520_04091 [Fonsecaea multimorphosa CBS 102226]OAL26922.1 hypothetical protein AYO22_03866 [Fonsecaea multimorphosa]
MAGSAGGRDQPSHDPTGNFAGSGASHFASSYYPIDTELTSMSPNYPMPAYARPMEEGVASVDKINHGAMNNNLSMGPNGAAASPATDPAMAPPQTPNQPTVPPGGARSSIDAASEAPQDPQTGDKRKRSKASRACDECRRKKVKCDAPTEADGTPKTCTNCQKAGVNCEFERKPMKRGPSKGYISALAERVHGLEQKQRQSLDAGPVGFAESFSPDEASGPAFQRASSFSASTTVNPFSRAEFQRDRIPSTGGWGITSIAPNLRSRASGSLAIAPNETFPAATPEEEANPKAEFRDSTTSLSSQANSSHRAKRPRIQAPNEDMLPVRMDQPFLAKYYEQYHPLFPLLPDHDIVNAVVSGADTEMQHAFVVAVDLLPDLRAGVTLNGAHESSSSLNHDLDPAISRPTRTLTSTHFADYDKLLEYLCSSVNGVPMTHSLNTSLTLAWALALISVTCENDAKHLGDDGVKSKLEVLNHSRLTLNHLRAGAVRGGDIPIPFSDQPGYIDTLNLALNCVLLSSKYHFLSLALHPTNEIHQHYLSIRSEDIDPKALTVEAAYMQTSSNQVELLAQILWPYEGTTAEKRFSHKAFLQEYFNSHLLIYAGSLGDSAIVKQFHWFLEVMLSPYQPVTPPFPTPILDGAVNLARVLIEDAKATSSAPRYNPLDLHTWSVAAITLSEIVADVSRKPIVDYARKHLADLRTELQKKSDAMHKHYDFEWFFGGNVKHWTDGLMSMIDYVMEEHPSAVDENRNSSAILVPNFAEMMEKGWLQTLLYFVDK